MGDKTIRLGIEAVKVLQALRAGSMNAEGLSERFSSYSAAISTLLSAKYVEKTDNGSYRITALGRENCPNRNKLLDKKALVLPIATAPAAPRIASDFVPLKLSEPPPRRDELLVTKVLAAKESLTEQANIETVTNNNERIVNMEVQPSSDKKPNALQILEFIEKNPGCITSAIVKATGIEGIGAYIKFHIVRGDVIAKDVEGVRAKQYWLKEGKTAESIYNQNNKRTGFNVDKPLAKSPAFTADPHDVTLDMIKSDPILNQKTDSNQNEYGRFRVAITSDYTMLIEGLQSTPIELTVAQTDTLIKFVSHAV